MQRIYQQLYENTDYGRYEHERCPGCRYFPLYRRFLVEPIIDLGCGSGDTVQKIRENKLNADGIDFVSLNNGMLVGDICAPLDLKKYNTSLCIDVFEHIVNLEQLIKNMQQTQRQIITVFSGSSIEDDVELHLNIKSIKEWDRFISNNFNIVDSLVLSRKRKLYLCKAS